MINEGLSDSSMDRQRFDFQPFKAWLNWCLAVLFVILVFSFQTGYAITNLGMQADLSLSVAQIGLIGSIYTWAFALTQILSGSILDRLGIRWVLPSAAAIVSIGGLIFAHASSLEALIAGQVLMAIGGSFGFIGAGYTGGAWFGALKYGLMFSWVQFVSSMSALAGQRILGQLVTRIAWQEILASMAWAGLVLSLFMFILMRNPLSRNQSKTHWPGGFGFLRSVFSALHEVLSIRGSWINALISGASFGSMLALGIVWGPKFLVATGMSQTDAFTASSTMWAGLALGAPAFIWFSETLRSRKWPLLIGCALQLLTIEAVMFLSDVSPLTATVIFFIWGFMAAASMLNFAVGADLVREELTGTSAAVVNAVQFITAGLIMAIPGWILSRLTSDRMADAVSSGLQNTYFDHQLALLIFPGSLSVALLLFPFFHETHPRA